MIPALIFLHYHVRDMEIENTKLLDEIYNDVSIEPLIHGKRIESERSKLATRVRELLKHIGNFRQKLVNLLGKFQLRVPFETGSKVVDLATRVSDFLPSSKKLALSFVVASPETKRHKDASSSSSSSSSSSDFSSSCSSASSSSDDDDDDDVDSTYGKIVLEHKDSKSWNISVSKVVHMGDHMRYVISVKAPDSAKTSWRLLYRFTAIKHFHRLLRSKSEIWRSTRFALPAKGMLRSKNDPEVVEERCKAVTKMLSLLTST